MFRTNHQRKYSSFTPKPTRRIGSTRWLEDELDALVREILPYLETHCFTCSKTHGLQVGHLFERRWRHGRWDTTVDGNNHRQCTQCNAQHEFESEIYINKYIDRFGPEAYHDLEIRVKSNQKLTYTELTELLAEKEAQLLKLQGKALPETEFHVLFNAEGGPVREEIITASCVLECEEALKKLHPEAVYWEIGAPESVVKGDPVRRIIRMLKGLRIET
jgi:hypothetical protein